MKKLLTLLAMAMMAVDVSAQAVIAEIDWTQESEYYHDLGWLPQNATASVTKEGLVIQSTPPDGANIWEANIPILAHIDGLKGNGRYQADIIIKKRGDADETILDQNLSEEHRQDGRCLLSLCRRPRCG